MKDRLMLIFSVSFLVFVIFIFINAVSVPEPIENKETRGRTSITFILGEDKVNDNPFYQNASAYFKSNPEAQTDFFIEDIRTLNQMIERLNDISEQSNRSFSEINMVIHSNPWAGMSLPLSEESGRITADILSRALNEKKVDSLSSLAVDNATILNVHACGLGNNQALLYELSRAFNRAQIVASEGYINFEIDNGLYKRSEMNTFYAFYPTAYKPADLHLVRQLEGRYPTTEMNWLDQLQKSSYRYNIPVTWEIKYPEYDVPELADELDKMEWLMNQDELLEIVEKTGIPFDNFRWRVKRGDDFVKVQGKVTVVCVMEKVNVAL